MAVSRRRAFTLIELLVVIGVTAVLLALLLPALQQTRATARLVQCRNNMKQIGLSLHNYHDVHGVFPPGSTSDCEQGGWIFDPQTQHIHSWLTMVLPFVDGAPLFEHVDFGVSSMHPHNRRVAATVIPVYRCPSYVGAPFSSAAHYTRYSPNYATTNYVAMGASDVGHIYGQNSGQFQPDGIIFHLSSTTTADVTDGLSNTLLVVETREAEMTVWMDGGTAAMVALRYDEANGPTFAGAEASLNYRPYFDYSDPRSEYGPSSLHIGGAVHLFGDGGVRFLSENLPASVYAALATRNGGEVVNSGSD